MLGRLTGAARRLRVALGAAPAPLPPPPRPAPPPTPMERYVAAGRIPWSDGYTKFKNQLLAEILADDAMLDRFATDRPLELALFDFMRSRSQRRKHIRRSHQGGRRS